MTSKNSKEELRAQLKTFLRDAAIVGKTFSMTNLFTAFIFGRKFDIGLMTLWEFVWDFLITRPAVTFKSFFYKKAMRQNRNIQFQNNSQSRLTREEFISINQQILQIQLQSNIVRSLDDLWLKLSVEEMMHIKVTKSHFSCINLCRMYNL